MDLQIGRVVSVDRKPESGTHHPFYAVIALPFGRHVDVVAKFPTFSPRTPPETVLNEWLATYCAAGCGLQVAYPYIATVTDQIRQHLYDRFGAEVIGYYGFASTHTSINPMLDPASEFRRSPKDACLLWAFDLIFLSADRIQNNPNCGMAKGRLFVYDFGGALLDPKEDPRRIDRFLYPPLMTGRASEHICRCAQFPLPLVESSAKKVIDAVRKLTPSIRSMFTTMPEEFANQGRLLLTYLELLVRDESSVVEQVVKVTDMMRWCD